MRKFPIGRILAVLSVVAILSYGALTAATPEFRTKIFYNTVAIVPFDPFRGMFEPLVPIWSQVEPGVMMKLDPYDLVSNQILIHGGWEKQNWARMESHIPEGGVFADVGAHIGYYSLKAARKVGTEGTVIAVEPNPETLVTLRANVAASGAYKLIKVQPVACSDTDAMLEFFAAPRRNTGESSLSKSNASQEGETANTYQVHARRLDDIVEEAGIQRLDVLKIDVEGADFLVLKGAERTLNRFHPVIYVETVEHQLKAMGGSVAELTAFVVAHGYKGTTLPGGNTEFVPIR